jgi:phosphate transport system substrate-binding protein
VATALTLLVAACGGRDPGQSPPVARDILNVPGARDRAALSGVGSSFVEPLLREWIGRYKTLAPEVTIDYEATGSPVAVERLLDGEGDFFASDVYLSELQEVTLGGSDAVVQVPWAAGAIALAYNLPDVGQLRLSPQAVAGIFSGRITRWDDAAIRSDNPDVPLPGIPISVVYRSDESGTSSVFTTYLSEVVPGWPLGSGRTVRFPRGSSAAGSEGVAAAVARTTGAVGYVGLAWARRASLSVALLGNRAGRFVEPTPEAVNAALVNAGLRPYGTIAQLNFNPESPGAYPLSTFSYLLYRRDLADSDSDKATALRHFAAWASSEGQRMAEPLGYGKVPRQFQVPGLSALQKP